MELDQDKNYFLIPKFENYVLDTNTFKIKNLKNNKVVRPLKHSKTFKFKLSKNGMNYYLTLWQILIAIFGNNVFKNKT